LQAASDAGAGGSGLPFRAELREIGVGCGLFD
jgi:hypothetical protein